MTLDDLLRIAGAESRPVYARRQAWDTSNSPEPWALLLDAGPGRSRFVPFSCQSLAFTAFVQNAEMGATDWYELGKLDARALQLREAMERVRKADPTGKQSLLNEAQAAAVLAQYNADIEWLDLAEGLGIPEPPEELPDGDA